MKLQWRQDPDAEKVIRDFANIDFTIQEISFEDIDWNESSHNCARLGNPLNQEKIEEYASAFRSGDVFPMPVVEYSDGKFIILGGNQRCNALKLLNLKDLVISVYVVDELTSGNRELIIRSLNSRHGWGSSKSERLEHAVFLVEAKGIATDVAAKAMMVSGVSIGVRIRANACRAELVKAGLKEAADTKVLTNAHLNELSRVVDESRRVQIAKGVIETKAAAGDVDQLVRGVLASKTQAGAHKLIADNIKQWHSHRTASSKKSNNKFRDGWSRRVNDLVKFLETGNQGGAFASFDELGLSRADIDVAIVSIAKITSRFNCLTECERGKR